MDVRNCNRCKKIFTYVAGQSVCAQCKKELETLFNDTRTFIRRNPEASIQEVADTCGVDSRQIKQWIREERLSFSKDSVVGIECEKCGITIKTGRFCDKCKSETLSALNSMREPQNSASIEAKPKEAPKSQMRFMDKEHRR